MSEATGKYYHGARSRHHTLYSVFFCDGAGQGGRYNCRAFIIGEHHANL